MYIYKYHEFAFARELDQCYLSFFLFLFISPTTRMSYTAPATRLFPIAMNGHIEFTHEYPLTIQQRLAPAQTRLLPPIPPRPTQN